MKPTTVEKQPSATFKLDAAALVYSNGADAYVTLHKVDTKGGRATIGAGEPATKAKLTRIVEAISGQVGMQGWMDSRVLYMSGKALVWWRPAGPVTMHFAKHGKHPARSGTAIQPPLIFAVTDQAWYVWAIADRHLRDRPEPQTTLAHAPYFNVYHDGGICTGNVKLPREIAPQTIWEFQYAFFGSRFTHPNHEPITKSDPFEVWANQLDHPQREFPSDELIANHLTLADVVQRISKGRA